MLVILMRFLAAIVLMVNSVTAASAETWQIERRRAQFPKEDAYFVLPSPYSLPGLGQGWFALGAAVNILDTTTDVFGFALTGDIQGYGMGVLDIPVISNRLLVDLNTEQLSKISLRDYAGRGMSSPQNDFTIVEFDKVNFYGTRFTLNFFERMLETYTYYYQSGLRLQKIKSRSNRTIEDVQDAQMNVSKVVIFGGRVDWTDDYQDPRKGLRVDINQTRSLTQSKDYSDQYIMNYNNTFYWPITPRLSAVFNLYKSDAVILRTGLISTDKISQKTGLHCNEVVEDKDHQRCNDVLASLIANNRHGTSTALGGNSRLRSYVTDRFKGAHSLFYGTELRWNLTEEFTPFNVWFMKDIRTGVQLAIFYENGMVADHLNDLGKYNRESYGLGLRIVAASGLIYRLDYATGSEGPQLTILIGYPWESI